MKELISIEDVLLLYNQPGNDVWTLVGLHRGTRTHLETDLEVSNMCFSFERGGGGAQVALVLNFDFR